MAALEIISVSTPDETPEQLWNSNIDTPAAGAAFDQQVLHVAAWAIGRSAPAAAVEITSGERILAVAPLRMPRPDLSRAYPDTAEAGLAGMAVDLDAGVLPEEFELDLRVILQNGERVHIGSVKGRRGHPSGIPDAVPAPTLHEDVRALISKVAGDHPEFAGLDERGAHDAILDRLVLDGRKVLDIGAGLGDTSRALRARGAAIVDGLEPDRELVRIARLLTAYHHTTRVSFHAADIAAPDAYAEHYDVVLALGAFDRVGQVLARIAGITDGVFVTIVPDTDQSVAVIREAFDHHEVLGPAGESSAGHVLAAAHSEQALASALRSADASEVAR
jgi:protein-L-isoaspartate O-methyltransferase